jgi:membrane protease subunit HflC
MFMVDQRQFAVVFQLGELIRTRTAGPRLEDPAAAEHRFFDKRILTLDSPEAERYLTSEKKNVLSTCSSNGESSTPSASTRRSRAARRTSTPRNARRRGCHRRSTRSCARNSASGPCTRSCPGERDKIMKIVQEKANADAQTFGAQIIDVRLKRVDYVQEISDSVYRRMEAERKRVANELRSEGAAEKERIQADADKQREVILAEAFRKAQQIKGAADAKRPRSMRPRTGRMPSSTRSTGASRPTGRLSSRKATCSCWNRMPNSSDT